MNKTRFLMVGGFLGAGKTTAIGRLAKTLQDRGYSVGLVTNDQAFSLVDTGNLQRLGMPVEEVAGACFCCKFNDLVGTLSSLEAKNQPDIVIAEPVGSCTDLVATVIEPLRHFHGDRYDLGMYVVLMKPEHGKKILSQEPNSGFSPKAAYIFNKQLEEADVIALNKIDILSEEDQANLMNLIQTHFPEKEVCSLSAKEGDNFEHFIELMFKDAPEGLQKMEVDYDIYAEGEAELGWLNAKVQLEASPESEDSSFLLDELVMNLTERLQEKLNEQPAEIAHLKILGTQDGHSTVVSVVSSDQKPDLALAAEVEVPTAELIINARVACSPEELTEIVKNCVIETANAYHLVSTMEGLQSFRPGRPVPTHRMV
ncbi:Signal recognition particle-docking protein FtsY [Planctomycetales bacterium 10988]|nr:Signal recognition particle-docking protein FtsY [Planctomycetales bacterium 10988]